MLMMKKIQALAETVLWLAVVVLMICVCLPIGAGLTFAGMLFRLVHVNFVSEIARRFMNMIVVFVKFVTRRIRQRTQEIQALRAKNDIQ
ncbi:MAG: hypothetical protein IJS28_05505 [Synergistaceae bacterium]|nr:hypothetical protein [Synergistaceae bacterium]